MARDLKEKIRKACEQSDRHGFFEVRKGRAECIIENTEDDYRIDITQLNEDDVSVNVGSGAGGITEKVIHDVENIDIDDHNGSFTFEVQGDETLEWHQRGYL